MLGVISKTRQGCEVLKQYGWDAVRHSRRTLWPVTPEEVDTQLTSELSSVPSTLSLNSESTSSRHNSESESQPSTYDLVCICRQSEKFIDSFNSFFFLSL